MLQPNVFDFILLLILGGTVLGACNRGLGVEVFHSIVFGVLIFAGGMVFRIPAGLLTPEASADWLMKMSYFFITAYLLTWGIMHSFGHIFIGHPHGLPLFRSRFWAGVLSMAKLALILFGMAVWFSVHNPLPTPQRLGTLPSFVRNSAMVALIDRQADGVAAWVVGHGLMQAVEKPELPAQPAGAQPAAAQLEVSATVPAEQTAPDLSATETQELGTMLEVSGTEGSIPAVQQ
jgi:hypothetical protein